MNKIKRLLEVLSSYLFDLYYITDSQKHDESDPHEIILISFNTQEVLQVKYYNIHENEQKRYLFEMRSQAKTIETVLPKVHAIDKGVDPNVRPEKVIIMPVVTSVQSHVPTESTDQCHVKPRLGQGRAGIKKKMVRLSMPQTCD